MTDEKEDKHKGTTIIETKKQSNNESKEVAEQKNNKNIINQKDYVEFSKEDLEKNIGSKYDKSSSEKNYGLGSAYSTSTTKTDDAEHKSQNHMHYDQKRDEGYYHRYGRDRNYTHDNYDVNGPHGMENAVGKNNNPRKEDQRKTKNKQDPSDEFDYSEKTKD